MRLALSRPLRVVVGLLLVGAAAPDAIDAQPVPIRRADAIHAALGASPALGVGRADSATAAALLLIARARPEPSLSAAYSQATPNYHVTADLPFESGRLRRARIAAADVGRRAAGLRFASQRTLLLLAADTTYTRALAARALLRLSERNARDADSLRIIAAARRDAGDAADLDVQIAEIFAGQQRNVAANDSLTLVSTLLDLQAVMGVQAADVAIDPVDSLDPPPLDDPPSTASAPAGPPLAIAAAQASLEAARLSALAERRNVWNAPTLTAGFETGDPSGSEPGILPTVGISLPLPLLGRNRGPIALAEAERERARAELSIAQLESRTAIARGARVRLAAIERVRRGRQLVATATIVGTKALVAYREGASPLASVLEAQRGAREVLAQYVTDLADLWIADATLRALTASTADSR